MPREHLIEIEHHGTKITIYGYSAQNENGNWVYDTEIYIDKDNQHLKMMPCQDDPIFKNKEEATIFWKHNLNLLKKRSENIDQFFIP